MICDTCPSTLFVGEHRLGRCTPCDRRVARRFKWLMAIGGRRVRGVKISARLLVSACKAWRVTNEALQQGLSRDRSRGPGAHAGTGGTQQ